jgi:hypothetical protein
MTKSDRRRALLVALSGLPFLLWILFGAIGHRDPFVGFISAIVFILGGGYSIIRAEP